MIPENESPIECVGVSPIARERGYVRMDDPPDPPDEAGAIGAPIFDGLRAPSYPTTLRIDADDWTLWDSIRNVQCLGRSTRYRMVTGVSRNAKYGINYFDRIDDPASPEKWEYWTIDHQGWCVVLTSPMHYHAALRGAMIAHLSAVEV